MRIIRFLRDVTLCSRRELQPSFDGSLNLPATRMADPQEGGKRKRGGKKEKKEMFRDDPRPSAPVCQNVAESLSSGKSTLLDGGAQSGGVLEWPGQVESGDYRGAASVQSRRDAAGGPLTFKPAFSESALSD